MTKGRTIAVSATVVIAAIVIGVIWFLVRPKLFLAGAHSPSIEISVSMESDRIPVGQKPRAILTVRNVGNQNWMGGMNQENYRVHVEGESAEVRKQDIEATSPGFYDALPPGMSRTMKWELSAFYDLNAPGKYTAYFEVQEKPGVWLQTNTVQFEMLAQAQ